MRFLLYVLVGVTTLFIFQTNANAENKSHTGLFGSYRREQFIENQANASDFGINFNLATLIPITGYVSSTETTVSGPMQFSLFFNVDVEPFITYGYHWQFFFRTGYHSYDTRKRNTDDTSDAETLGTEALFHEFRLISIPLMLGARYRFNTTDVVPYVGAAAGVAYYERTGFYDYAPEEGKVTSLPLVAELQAGIEFYFTSTAGLKLEVAGHYAALGAHTLDVVGAVSRPDINYLANPISIRYASGIFVLF